MNQYNPLFASSDADSNKDKHDERSSTSGSDDGSSYFNFPDTQKMDEDILDDDTSSLTSQTLNADGTPKRPMNAFMIFARRRRPQVSAENQSMRTGEISKILSKEWNTMPATEKQFFLDQAKQLKDTFNSKYPDYIYRRRPNNSRKRRRGDSGNSRLEQSPSDQGDDHDLMPVGDLSESPIDREGSASAFSDHSDLGLGGLANGRGSHHHLHSHHPYHHLPHHHLPQHAHSYGSAEHQLNHSRTHSYPPFTQDLFYSRSHEPRIPFLGSTTTSGSDRLSHLTASAASSSAVSPHSHSTNYTYSSSPFSSSSPPLLSSDPSTTASTSSNGSTSTVMASASTSGGISGSASSWARQWLPSALATHDLPVGSTGSAGSSPVSSWPSSSTDSSSTSSGTGSGSSSSSSSAFPTLSSPFFPSGTGSSTTASSSTANGLTPRRSYDLGVPSYASSPSSSIYGLSNGGTTRSGSPLYSNLGGSSRHSFSGGSSISAPRSSIAMGGIPPISSLSTSGGSSSGTYAPLPSLSHLSGGAASGNPYLSQSSYAGAGGYGSSTTSSSSSAGGSPQMGLGLGVGVSGFWQARGDKIEGC